MRVIMIRHGQYDSSFCEEQNINGHGIDLAPLSSNGIEQAKLVAKNPILKDAQIILSSPLTRALQTASYVATETKLDILVEVELREWQPDLTYQKATKSNIHIAYEDYLAHNGIYTQNEQKNWETAKMVFCRAYNCLKNYNDKYSKIIVVAHGELMRQFKSTELMPYCGIIEFEFNEISLKEWCTKEA